ncbi:MAG: alpha/beta hydrolase-fold protein [Dermatophilaceae bacterium]
MSQRISRRAVMAGAVALPLLAACSRGQDKPAGVDLQEGNFSPRFWPDHTVRWRLARPVRKGSQTASTPLVVALHGYGGDADWAFASAHVERHIVQTGLAVATVDGGDYYWHARRSGIDPGSMIAQELLPLLAGRGLATGRIGLIGWSMGGYGALLLASRLGPRRVAGVAAASAALWQSPGDSAPGAFDDAKDFASNDVFAQLGRLRSIPVRLDCGRDDPFIAANRALAHDLPDAAARFDAGSHTEEYWTAHTGAEMSWLRQQFNAPSLL